MSNIVKLTQKDIQEGLNVYKDNLKKIIKEDVLIKEIGFATMAVNQNEKLQQCTQNSILQSIYNVATVGLSLNPIKKEAALTPRYVKGQWQCVLSPMYQGLVKLITDTGSIKNIYAYNVYDGDEFDVSLGTDINIIHKPKYESKSIIKTYAVAVLADGSKAFEVMTREDIESVRDVSETWKAYKAEKITEQNCIWVTWEDEMFRKTVIKRLVKYIPKSSKFEKVQEVIELDNSDFGASDSQIAYIEGLIRTSTYDHDTQEFLIEKVNNGITSSEASSMINDLQLNQLSDFDRGYISQTAIKEKINESLNN